MSVIELNPNHLWFDVSTEIKKEVSNRANNYFSNYRRAYLNLLAQEIILPYLQEDYSNAKLGKDIAEFWQLGINGIIISIDDKKFALIPSETYDIDELRVDREWVDIPELAADYFLAVQLDTEENMMRIWGYTTHKELKEKGTYTERDRTYSLEREDITEEISALWLTNRHFPNRATQSAIATLPELSEDILLESVGQLASSQILFPRRMLDFARWGKLICQKKWRVELIQQLQFAIGESDGLSTQAVRRWSVMDRWKAAVSQAADRVNTKLDELAEQAEWLLVSPQVASRSMTTTPRKDAPKYFKRLIIIAGDKYQLRIKPINISSNTWKFELSNVDSQGKIPVGLKFRLLDEHGQEFENNERVAIEGQKALVFEQLEFEAGEGIIWEIEPTPDNYQREIIDF